MIVATLNSDPLRFGCDNMSRMVVSMVETATVPVGVLRRCIARSGVLAELMNSTRTRPKLRERSRAGVVT